MKNKYISAFAIAVSFGLLVGCSNKTDDVISDNVQTQAVESSESVVETVETASQNESAESISTTETVEVSKEDESLNDGMLYFESLLEQTDYLWGEDDTADQYFNDTYIHVMLDSYTGFVYDFQSDKASLKVFDMDYADESTQNQFNDTKGTYLNDIKIITEGEYSYDDIISKLNEVMSNQNEVSQQEEAAKPTQPTQPTQQTQQPTQQQQNQNPPQNNEPVDPDINQQYQDMIDNGQITVVDPSNGLDPSNPFYGFD